MVSLVSPDKSVMMRAGRFHVNTDNLKTSCLDKFDCLFVYNGNSILSKHIVFNLCMFMVSRSVRTCGLSFFECVLKQKVHLAYTRCSLVRNMCFA